MLLLIADVFSPVIASPGGPGTVQSHSQSPHVVLTTGASGAASVSTTTSSGTTATTSNSAIPVQHLLIPVSVGNGLQQLISIPLSLAAGAGNHIQLLATSSGQLIAANMAAALQQPAASHGTGKLFNVYHCIVEWHSTAGSHQVRCELQV